MQRQLIRKQFLSARQFCCHRPPRCRRQIVVQRSTLNKEDAPQPSSTGQSSDAALDPLTVEVAEATVLEPGAVSETSTSEGEGAAAAALAAGLVLTEPPPSVNRAAALQYGALGAVYAVVAGAVGFAALRAPQTLLAPTSAADPWAATLLGCLAATYVRAAGVFLHLKAAADNGELLCMRHQRLAFGAALYGVVALASQALGLASVQLAGLQLGLVLATCVVVVNVARSVLAVDRFVAVAGDGPVVSTTDLAGAALAGLVDSLGTVAGLLLTVLTGMSLYGFGAVVFGAPPPVLASWPGQPTTLDAASAGLRRLAGAGLLLLAAHAHGLQDFAESVRQPPNLATLSGFRHFMLQYLLRTRDRLSKYFMPVPETYTWLNAAFVAAAVVQAFFVVRAPGLGVDVNLDGALWGPMFGTWIVALLYGIVALTSFDWEAAGQLLFTAVNWSSNLVLRFFDRFVWKFQWAHRHKRS